MLLSLSLIIINYCIIKMVCGWVEAEIIMGLLRSGGKFMADTDFDPGTSLAHNSYSFPLLYTSSFVVVALQRLQFVLPKMEPNT